MIANLRLKLVILMSMLLGAALSVGGVALWGTYQQNRVLETVEQSTSALATTAKPLHDAFEGVSARAQKMSEIANSLDKQFSDVAELVAQSDAAADEATAENMQELAWTGIQLLDRHLDRLQLLVDALTKSDEVRNGIHDFRLSCLQELGWIKDSSTESLNRWKEVQQVVASDIEALLATANAETYIIIGLEGNERGKALFSNHERYFGKDFSGSKIFQEVLLENRITKGLDLIENELFLGAGNVIHSSSGHDVAVLICGSAIDLASLRFLATDLHANLALFLPSQDGYKCVHSTFTNSLDQVSFEIPIPENVHQFFRQRISELTQKESGTIHCGKAMRESFAAYARLDVGGTTYSTCFQALFDNDSNILGLLGVGRDIQEMVNRREQVVIQSALARNQVASMALSRSEIETSHREQDEKIIQLSMASRRAESSLNDIVEKARALSQYARTTVWIALAVAIVIFAVILAFTQGKVLSPLESAISALVASKCQLEAQATELEQAKSEAEAASKSKSDFLANMSHEIRTPMTAILGFAELIIEDRSVDLSEQQLGSIETIKRSGNHLLSIINDILDISKIEAGKFTLEMMPTKFDEVIRDALKLFDGPAREKGIELTCRCLSPIPQSIVSDPCRLKQILVNLVGNAIKFTEQGSISIELLFEPTSHLSVSVVDTGVGLKPEQMKRLFQAFEQADNSITRKYGGSGLGLRICQKIAQMLNGDITVESEFGVGSRFCMRIPLELPSNYTTFESLELRAPEKEATKTADASPFDTDQPLKDLRILLAEDGHDNQKLIGYFLRKAGAQLTIVENGKLAVEALTESGSLDSPLLKSPPFDLMLLDMQMPIMDGYSTANYLRSHGSQMPIIALTAHAMSSDRKKCIDAGCDSYLTKPINKLELIKSCLTFVSESVALEPPKPVAPALKTDIPIDPIFSQFADDSEMGELIAYFVESLRSVIESITNDFRNEDFSHLGQTAHQLKGAGGGYGFPAISEAAKKVEVRVNAKMDAIGLRSAVEELLSVCKGAVLGSMSRGNAAANLNLFADSKVSDYSGSKV